MDGWMDGWIDGWMDVDGQPTAPVLGAELILLNLF